MGGRTPDRIANKEEAKQLHPYTMQEIDYMLNEAESAFEAGDYLT